MAHKGICVLYPEEVEMLLHNLSPNCADHSHISRAEAMEMTCRGDFRPYSIPIAEWVGPKHIRLLQVWAIRGMSCKIGRELTLAVARKENWALAMLAQIQMRIEPRTQTEVL